MTHRSFTARVYGIVQGVSFRYHTRRRARQLDLGGFVKNMPDGSVYLEATGEKKALKQLADWLHDGPAYASVSRVNIDWSEEERPFSTFEIVL